MRGRRLDRPLALAGLEPLLDAGELQRLQAVGMLAIDGDEMSLSERGRFMANDVVSSILR
jgi:coproporphyrinogen III oxidase-like Fe-S oxidoreductase